MDTKKRRGFTLTELLVVVVVMAVLVAIGVPIYKKTVDKSRVSDAIHVLETVAAKQEAVWVETGKYAPNFSQLAAPIKGLNTAGEAKIGNYTYNMNKACATASHSNKYTIYKNFITNETGCTGSACDLVKGIVDEASVNCDYTIPDDGSGETPVPPDDIDVCSLNPAACCPAGTNWTGTACVRCNFPKVWNSAASKCVCGNICAGNNTPNELDCSCPCTTTCTGGKELGPDCNCYCPASKPNWDGSKCVSACSSPKTRWNETTSSCECPLGYPIYVSSENKCISGCVPPQVWNGASCVCGDDTKQAKNNCIATGGTWSESSCTCVCNSPRTVYSNLGCSCPDPKSRWSGNSCECPLDRPLYHSNTNTCTVPCSNPLEWNFSTLKCECPSSFNAKKETCLSSGGQWNSDTCSCVCALPRELNASSGACECFAPRTNWTGTSCDCPIANPNWNATNKTCNPPCSDPKLYWDGAQCICQPDKPKYVSQFNAPKFEAISNKCCLASQGEACGGGVTNSVAGVNPCLGATCNCANDTVLAGGYCCAATTPYFINQTWGCCKTTDASKACGDGIANSGATGVIACNTAQCSNCTGKYPSLREDPAKAGTKYCCLGTCANGNFSGSGANTCNCDCYIGFKLNASTGNCESCGVCENCDWTDNKCAYNCKEGYCRDGNGKCTKIPTGQYRAADQKCTACTGLLPNAKWTGAGTTTATSCPWECTTGNCYNQAENACKAIPVGQWRNGNNCTNCTGKPANNSVYTDNGGTTNSCPWSCDPLTTCHNGTDCVPIAVGQWRTATGACSDCWKPENSSLVGVGDTSGPNSCKWWCHGAYCEENNACSRTSKDKFRAGDDKCVNCSASTQCWDSVSLTCKTTTADLKRNSETGLCTACTTASGCWNENTNSCVKPVGEYRDSQGECTACTNGGAVAPGVKVYTTYGNANNTCQINCTPELSTCLNGANNTTGNCVSIPTGQWRNGVLCKACDSTKPTGSSYNSGGGTSNGCSWKCDGSVKCAMAVNGSCATPAKDYYTDDNKLCKACTNQKPTGSSYSATGGATNSCAWTCPAGQCAMSAGGTCAVPAKGYYTDDNKVCKACTNAKPSNATYSTSGGTTNSCTWVCTSGQCSETGTDSCKVPSPGWKNPSNQVCSECTDTLPLGASFTTSNSCTWSCGSGKCSVDGSPCAATPLNYTQGTNTFCVACANTIPAGSTRVKADDCATWQCPVGQCSMNGTAACAVPGNGFYTDDRKTCKTCTNGPSDTSNFTYTSQGNGANSCSFFPKDGFCLWNNDTRSTSYYNETGDTSHWRDSDGRCVTCANKPSGSSYTSHGTSADCPWKCSTSQCSIGGTEACAALKPGYLDTGSDKICTVCASGSIPSGSSYTTAGNCAAYTCGSGKCSQDGAACAVPAAGYTNPSNAACTKCTAIPSGASYTTGGSCAWQCPANQCSNDGAACAAPPVGKYVPANRQGCVACTNTKPSGSTYSTSGGTTNSCAWKCTTGCSLSASGTCGNFNGYTNSSGNTTCTACAAIPSGASWTATNSCSSWTCGSGKCSTDGSSACVALPLGYLNTGSDKICNSCAGGSIPSGASYTTVGNCSSYVCPSSKCSTSGGACAAPAAGFLNPDNVACSACAAIPSGASFTTAGTCDWACPANQCSNGGAACSAPPVGQYVPASRQYCTACTNTKPTGSTYSSGGGTTNTCAWKCTTGCALSASGTCGSHNGYLNSSGNTTCTACAAVPSGATWTAASDCSAWTCGSGKCSTNGTAACAAAPLNYTNTTNKLCTSCSNTIPSGSSRTVAGDCDTWACASGKCSTAGGACAAPAAGYTNPDNTACQGCGAIPEGASFYSGGACDWQCPAGQCSEAGAKCAAPGVGKYVPSNRQYCQPCSNAKPTGSSYTTSGGTANNCSWKCNTTACAINANGTCGSHNGYTNSSGNTTCTACAAIPGGATWTATNSCSSWTCGTGKCSISGGTCSTPPVNYSTASTQACAACSNTIPSGASRTTGGDCSLWTCGTGKCSVGGTAACAAAAAGYTNPDNTACSACAAIPSGASFTTAGSCVWQCPVGQCSNGGAACAAPPVGQYVPANRQSCTSCSNTKPSGSEYSSSGGTANNCSWKCTTGCSVNGTTACGNFNGYTNSSGNTLCTACTNLPSGASWTGANDCGSWTCGSGKCSVGGGACAAPPVNYQNTTNKECTACSNTIPSGASRTTGGDCATWTCGSGKCSVSGGACAAAPAGYTNPSNTNCASCSSIPSGASYTTGGSCDWSCPANQCSNGGAACAAPPTGTYVPANRQYCTACTNTKPTGSTYSSSGGTTNSCSWKCTSGCALAASGTCANHNGYTNSSGNTLCTACAAIPSGATWTGANNCSAWACPSGKCSMSGGACATPPVNYSTASTQACSACSNSIPSGSSRTVGGDCNSWACSSGYCSRNGTEACGQYTGYYTSTNKLCTACSNGPDASGTYDYSSSGGGSNNCGIIPRTGYCLWHDGNKWQTSNYYSYGPDSAYYRDSSYKCQSCTNKPANASYTGYGTGTNNCTWTCNAGYSLYNGRCVVCTSGQTRNNTACSTGCGQNYEYCVDNGGANYWATYNSCTAPSCGTPNTLSNPTYRYVDNTSNTCSSEGFPCPTNGSRYYYKQQVCTCSGWSYTTGNYILYKDDCTNPKCDGTSVGGSRTTYDYAKCSATDSNLCGDNVSTDRRRSKTQQCQCSGSSAAWVDTSGWGGWSNYSTSCYAKNCSLATSQACGTNNNGTQYRTCTATSCSGGTYTAWGACACGVGWCGSACNININQTCSVGENAYPFHSTCNGNGTLRTKCTSGCPNTYSQYCECAQGYQGEFCDSAPTTNTTYTKPAIVSCYSGSSTRYYSAYESVSSSYTEAQYCGVDLANGGCFISISDTPSHLQYSGSNYITGTVCPSGQTDAYICANNALGYKCIKYASTSTNDSCGSTYTERQCDCRTCTSGDYNCAMYSSLNEKALGIKIIDDCNVYCTTYGSYTRYTGNKKNVSVLVCGGAECPAMADGTGKTEVDAANCRQRTCNASTLRWGSYTTTLGTDQCCSAQVTSSYKPYRSCGTCGKQYCNASGNTYGSCVNPTCCYGNTTTSGCSSGYYKKCTVYDSATGFYNYGSCEKQPGCTYSGTNYAVGEYRVQGCLCKQCLSSGSWTNASTSYCRLPTSCGGDCLQPIAALIPCEIEMI